jgi:hypothetical protein
MFADQRFGVDTTTTMWEVRRVLTVVTCRDEPNTRSKILRNTSIKVCHE